MREYVYFIGHEEAVKIGYTTTSVNKRLSSIQTGNPKPLARLAVITCVNAADVERQLHKTFHEWRVEGEWFTRNPKLDFVINYLSTCSSKTTVEHLEPAYQAFEKMNAFNPLPMNYEEMFLADTLLMMTNDLYFANETVDSLQLRYAVAYYRNWLMNLCTMKYKKFKTATTLRGGKKITTWNAVTEVGKVYTCPNYFYSEEFANLKNSEPKAILMAEYQEITECQLELFNAA